MVKKTDTAAAPLSSNTEFLSIKKWNLWLGLLLLFEAAAIVVAGKNIALPLTTQYLAVDTLASGTAGHTVLAVASRQIASISLPWLVASVLLIQGLAGVLYATKLRRTYETSLDTQTYGAKWAALALMGGLLVVAVGMLSGVYSMPVLLVLLLATMAACGLGFARNTDQLRSAPRPFKRALCASTWALASAPWIVFISMALSALLFGGQLPWYAYSAYGSLALMYVLVAKIEWLRKSAKGKWASAITRERAFLCGIAVLLSAFAWVVYFGALRP